jgi:hypothetical protein
LSSNPTNRDQGTWSNDVEDRREGFKIGTVFEVAKEHPAYARLACASDHDEKCAPFVCGKCLGEAANSLVLVGAVNDGAADEGLERADARLVILVGNHP